VRETTLAPAESAAVVANLLLLCDHLPNDLLGLGKPCVLTVTVHLELVDRGACGGAAAVWPGRLSFAYHYPLDVARLFGGANARRDFTTISVTGAPADGRAAGVLVASC